MLGTELKICPFCGAKPNPPNFTLDQCGKYGALQCPECLALGPEVRAPYGTTEWQQIAADDWNRRAAPEPAQGDRERARDFILNLGDRYPKFASILTPEDVESLDVEFATVREEATKAERERCEKVSSRQLEYIEAARALQRKLNGIFPNHRPLYHANGGLCREADYHKELKDLNHALDEVAAAIRGAKNDNR